MQPAPAADALATEIFLAAGGVTLAAPAIRGEAECASVPTAAGGAVQPVPAIDAQATESFFASGGTTQPATARHGHRHHRRCSASLGRGRPGATGCGRRGRRDLHRIWGRPGPGSRGQRAGARLAERHGNPRLGWAPTRGSSDAREVALVATPAGARSPRCLPHARPQLWRQRRRNPHRGRSVPGGGTQLRRRGRGCLGR